ncbi:MAG: MFS transporter [Propionicimonas sp.]|uniref:MFS transporter n=1 Tax=Propionicimonas sp. TaxID=1955623 RepID=UPI003D12FB06
MSTSGAGRIRGSALVGVLLIALCLRPAITSVGPVLGEIGTDLGLGAVAQGVLGSIPLLCFAAASALVHALTARTGHHRAVTIALAGIAVAIGIRSLAVPGALWLGTILIGLSIAIGNVVVSGIVKREFARRVSLATGIYTAVMGVAASLASGLSEPLSSALGGWRPGLAVWAIPTVVALAAWLVTSRRMDAAAPAPAVADAAPTPWRSPLAWQVTGFFGLQSLSFYLVVTWLPTMAASLGMDAATAGWLLFWFQVVGVAAGPIAAAWADRLGDQRLLCAGTGAVLALAALGALAVPGWLWLWVTLAGVSAGASFALALALPPLRTRTPAQTVRLAGMAQAIGYLIAAVGPIAAGALAGATNSGRRRGRRRGAGPGPGVPRAGGGAGPADVIRPLSARNGASEPRGTRRTDGSRQAKVV